jgi:hypothetical protein
MTDLQKFIEEVREASGNAWDDADITRELELIRGKREKMDRYEKAMGVALIALCCIGIAGCGACFVASAVLTGIIKGSSQAITTDRR